MTRARQWQGRAGRSHGLATVDGPRSAPMAPPTRSPTAGPPPPTTRARGGPRRGRAARRVSGRGWACFGGRGCGLGCRDVAGLAHTPGYVKVATVPQRTHCSSWARPSSVPGNTRNLWNRHRQRSRPNRSSAVGGSAKGCGVMATRRDRATPNDTGTAFVPSTARPCLRSAGNRDLAPAGDGVADVGVGVRGAAALPTVVLGGWFRGRWPVDLGDGFRRGPTRSSCPRLGRGPRRDAHERRPDEAGGRLLVQRRRVGLGGRGGVERGDHEVAQRVGRGLTPGDPPDD